MPRQSQLAKSQIAMYMHRDRADALEVQVKTLTIKLKRLQREVDMWANRCGRLESELSVHDIPDPDDCDVTHLCDHDWVETVNISPVGTQVCMRCSAERRVKV